jgi:hypothetical protein
MDDLFRGFMVMSSVPGALKALTCVDVPRCVDPTVTNSVHFPRLVNFKCTSAIAQLLQSEIQAMAADSRAIGVPVSNSDCFSNVVNNFIKDFNLKVSLNGRSIEPCSRHNEPLSYDFAKMVFAKVLELFDVSKRFNYRKEREVLNESRRLCEAQQRSLKVQAEQFVAHLSNASRKTVEDVLRLQNDLERLRRDLRGVILKLRALSEIVENTSESAEPQTTMDEDDMIALKKRSCLLTAFLKSLNSSNFQCPFEESSELKLEYIELVETYTEMKPHDREQFVTNLQDDLHSLQSPAECSSVNLDDVHRQIEEVREVECQLKVQIDELEAKILEARSSSDGK